MNDVPATCCTPSIKLFQHQMSITVDEPAAERDHLAINAKIGNGGRYVLEYCGCMNGLSRIHVEDA